MPHINYLAVLVAAVAAFFLGSIWYSPLLFVKAWKAELAVSGNPARADRPMTTMLLVTMVAALLAAFAMAVLLVTPAHHSLEIGIKRGFAAGVCWVAMAFASTYAFEQRSFRHWAINGGYYVVQFTLMGAVLGVMQ